jgi:hypothetical protein
MEHHSEILKEMAMEHHSECLWEQGTETLKLGPARRGKRGKQKNGVRNENNGCIKSWHCLDTCEKSKSTNLRSQRDQEQCRWDHMCTVTFARNDREKYMVRTPQDMEQMQN